jgi:hypothetical protein
MDKVVFDEMAEFYRFRTPYNKNFFPKIAKALGCTSSCPSSYKLEQHLI